MTLNPNQQASLSLDSLADLKIVCDQLPFIKPGPSNPNTDPNSQLFKPLDSYINPPGTSPANPGQTVNAVEQHKNPCSSPNSSIKGNITLSTDNTGPCSISKPALALLDNPPSPSLSTCHKQLGSTAESTTSSKSNLACLRLASPIFIPPLNSPLSLTLVTYQEQPALASAPSEKDTECSDLIYSLTTPSCTSTSPLAPIEETPAQNLVNDIGDTLLTPSAPSPVYSSCPLPALSRCSFPIGCTAKACPDKYNIADMKAITINEYSDTSMDVLGSITIVEHSNTSVASNLAPDLSLSAKEHYDDIDNYLKILNSDENKKKKTPEPTPIEDNPILFDV
ncbi:hypothetical protein MJO28_005741 [Puccinia striiformis f. sp. tritici]|uniref:Uncharacterized protein n=2 Tax=Puccinia striiformis TaxID=27350 RepID=A0A2S4UHW9_9BASI|nr:hypothetical protein Pst134EA_009848 [Puccinia striiformis f. sp. tritici]KAH9469326.1 hypothetical protein Pst134EA_009848 [Puccinia striiformis f. sp. tritici]KAI7955341.1 hypothetical protein MJO28_005741 [Puccinia striiformis f. sp. tritici]KAI7960692.1 hypothetical protein MJO29_005760 [Puccinia striiformis f. sp. tritici]POV96734.1 hypothetical protein PSTT_15448 [Puccinia striiformis]